MAWRRGSKGSDPGSSAAVLVERGHAELAASRPEAALATFEQAIERAPQATDVYFTSRKGLGMALTALGQHRRAVRIYEALCADALRQVAADDPFIDEVQGSLAQAYRLNGEPARSVALYRKLLLRREAAYGPTGMPTLKAIKNLSLALWEMRQHAESIQYLQRFITNLEAAGLEADPMATDARDELCMMLDEVGRLDEAIELFRRQLSIRTTALGLKHFDTLRTMNSLALRLHRRDSREAMAMDRQLLQLLEETFGPDHEHTTAVRMRVPVLREFWTENIATGEVTRGVKIEHPWIDHDPR